jgi:hypothetical protein
MNSASLPTASPEAPRVNRDAYAASDARSHRQTASALRLVVDAAGGPVAWAGKLSRVALTVGTLVNRAEVRRRLARLESRGMFTREPSALQLVVLGADMLRYFIEPGARDYYATRGIDFSLHQLLRVLDDPSSMLDPVGLLSARDTIIGHALQVVHANPIYDLQLLEMFEDGLDEIERQTAAMIDGTHPRARSIGAIVEDPDYHRRLLAYVREYRRSPTAAELRRRDGSARNDPAFVLAEETFGAMTSAFRYALRLPTDVLGAVRHLQTKPTIDPALCEPEAIAAVARVFNA